MMQFFTQKEIYEEYFNSVCDYLQKNVKVGNVHVYGFQNKIVFTKSMNDSWEAKTADLQLSSRTGEWKIILYSFNAHVSKQEKDSGGLIMPYYKLDINWSWGQNEDIYPAQSFSLQRIVELITENYAKIDEDIEKYKSLVTRIKKAFEITSIGFDVKEIKE